MNRNKQRSKMPDSLQTELYDRITRLQVSIQERIQKAKVSSPLSMCEHIEVTSEQSPSYDASINYYDLFWRRFLLNEMTKTQIDKASKDVGKLQKRIHKIDGLFKEWEDETRPLTRQCKYKVPLPSEVKEKCKKCSRSYPDKESLAIHIKYKHPASQLPARPEERGRCNEDQPFFEQEQ